jgi:hypothetical protein
MDWPLIIAWGLIGLGLFAGAFIYARNPAFWVSFAIAAFWKLWPHLWGFVSKRKSPEEEAEWRREQLSGTKGPPKGTGVTTGKTITQPAAKRKT